MEAVRRGRGRRAAWSSLQPGFAVVTARFGPSAGRNQVLPRVARVVQCRKIARNGRGLRSIAEMSVDSGDVGC